MGVVNRSRHRVRPRGVGCRIWMSVRFARHDVVAARSAERAPLLTVFAAVHESAPDVVDGARFQQRGALW